MARSILLSLTLLSFYLCVSFTHALNNNGFSVELIHRDSPRSPLYNSKQTHSQRVSNAVRRSVNKASSSAPTTTPVTTVTSDKGEYLMSYSVGTPPFNLYGIVDTGSDIVWLQCKPCVECYNQTSPMFDPSKSTTYKNIPCSSATCRSVRDSFCSSSSSNNVQQQVCEYTINYGDGSQSQGDIAVETLTLDSTSDSPVSFPRFVIGCGHDNTVSFQGRSSGIVGLGGGPVSLITQLGSSIEGKFSYCLVPIYSESNTTSKLNFGGAAVVSGKGTVSTPIVPSSNDKVFYHLTLEAFSVGNKRIEFGGSNSYGEGNIIIDSGTTLTLLPDDVYSDLEAEVARVVKLERVNDPNMQLNLCYKTTASSGELDVPVITAHFSGADVQLNALNTFVQVADDVVCFAFISTPNGANSAIFGNVAQQNLLVGYDLQKNIVSFKPTDCTKQ